MVSVSTNIAALMAQKSMSDQIAKSDKAIERLSTGLCERNCPNGTYRDKTDDTCKNINI